MTGKLPAGVAFTRGPSETAVLAGSPAGRTGRLYRLTITATNGAVPAARQAFTLAVHRAPSIVSSRRPVFRDPADAAVSSSSARGFPVPALRQTGRLPRLHIPDPWHRNGGLDRRSCRIAGRRATCHQDHREQRRRPGRDPGADHREPPTVCRMPSRARATSINAPGPPKHCHVVTKQPGRFP